MRSYRGAIMDIDTALLRAIESKKSSEAARGQLEEAPALVARLETMAKELMQLAGTLSLDALRQQAGDVRDANRTVSR